MKQCSKDEDRAPDKHQTQVCQNRYELHYESCQSARNSQSQTTGCMSTAQHSTAQHSTAQHSTAQHQHTLMPMAFKRRSSRRFSTAKGKAGFVTRQVSSRKTRPGDSGMPYRNEGTSCWAPQTPSPAAGCSWSFNLQHATSCLKQKTLLLSPISY